MKKRLIMVILVVLLAALATLGLYFGLKDKHKEPVVQNGDTKKETELLFAFDSYEEILGSGVYLTKLFGDTEINTNKDYITEGKASWQLNPMGEYATSSCPAVRLKCEDSTFRSSNFDSYDKIMVDFYNASDEEVRVQWYFTMLNIEMEYEETPRTIYTLKPNEWTTCEFDLTEVDYSGYFYPDTVRDTTFLFLDKKESKEDLPYTVYVDNIRGHVSETERERVEFEYDALEGITFEQADDRYAFSILQARSLKRVSYDALAISQKNETFGEYCLQVDATACTWPHIIFDVGQEFEEDMLFTYNIYVEVDEKVVGDASYYVEHFSGDQYAGPSPRYAFNEWVEVTSYLPLEESILKFFVNLDKHGTGKSWFADDVQVNIYLDNLKISKPEEGVSLVDKITKKEDGTIVLKDAYKGDGQIRYVFDMKAKKGQAVYFDIDIEPKGQQAYFCLLACDINKEGWVKEIWADRDPAWSAPKSVAAMVREDTETFTILVMYESPDVDWSKNTATISNLRVGEAPPSDTISVDEDGTATLANKDGNNQVSYTFKKAAKAGQNLTFDLTITPSGQKANFWVLGCDTATDGWINEWWGDGESIWNVTRSFTVPIPQDTDVFTIPVVFSQTEGIALSDVEVVISNIKIVESDTITVEEDGTAILANKDGNNQVSYTFNKEVKAGQNLKFDLAITPAGQKANFWVLGCDTAKDGWKNEWWGDGESAWHTTRSFTVYIPQDTDVFTIPVVFSQTEGIDLSDVEVVISNIQIMESDSVTLEDGTAILANKDGNNQVSYTFKQEALKGQSIKFDLAIAPNGQKANFWVLGCDTAKDGWKNEWWGDGVSTWNGPRSFTVPVGADTDAFTIFVQFESQDVDLSQNVVTISNVSVVGNETYSFDEGLSFEKDVDLTAFTGTQVALSKVTYANAGIQAPTPEAGGNAMLANSTAGFLWPTVALNFGKNYPAGSILTYWVYVESAVATNDQTYVIESNSMGRMPGNRFNQWIKVEITLRESGSEIVMINLDGLNLSDNNVKIYMDSFQVEHNIAKPSETVLAALSGKKALFVGDSIMAGATDNECYYDVKSWPGRIAYYCNMGVTNNGVSGACVSNILEQHNTALYVYNNLIKAAEADYDYVIMQGLYNDWGNGAPLGEAQGMANFNPATADKTQFAQGLEYLFYTAKQQHPEAQLGFIITYKTRDGATTSLYTLKAIEICEDWGIPYIDLYHDSSFSIDLFDGLHPSTRGYDETYLKLAEWMADMDGYQNPPRNTITANPDGTMTFVNVSGNYVERSYDVSSLNLKAGDKVSVTFNLAQAGPTDVWSAMFINDTEMMADNITGTSRTITVTLTEDCTRLWVLVKNFHVADWENTITISDLQVGKADTATVNPDGSVTVHNADLDGLVSYTFTNLDIKAGDSITFTITVPGGDSRGFMGVEGIKGGVNFGSFYYDSDTVETYTRTITASADYDALNFWFRHGDWTALGNMRITFKIH